MKGKNIPDRCCLIFRTQNILCVKFEFYHEIWSPRIEPNNHTACTNDKIQNKCCRKTCKRVHSQQDVHNLANLWNFTKSSRDFLKSDDTIPVISQQSIAHLAILKPVVLYSLQWSIKKFRSIQSRSIPIKSPRIQLLPYNPTIKPLLTCTQKKTQETNFTHRISQSLDKIPSSPTRLGRSKPIAANESRRGFTCMLARNIPPSAHQRGTKKKPAVGTRGRRWGDTRTRGFPRIACVPRKVPACVFSPPAMDGKVPQGRGFFPLRAPIILGLFCWCSSGTFLILCPPRGWFVNG